MRAAFSESRSPADWVQWLIDEFKVSPEAGEIFACGWFAGRYAGVSDVLKVVQKEMDRLEKEKIEERSSWSQTDGYA